MIWIKLSLCSAASILLNSAFLLKAPEYAVISGVLFAVAIGLE